jgi:aerobic C4-dicarboxylate transport protein
VRQGTAPGAFAFTRHAVSTMILLPGPDEQEEGEQTMEDSPATGNPVSGAQKPLYRSLWVQVLVAVALAIIVGYVWPRTGVALKPLGDAFIQLISMVIALVVFCTVVTGIAGMGNLRKVGRVGGKALLYFEVVTTIALLFALLIGNLVETGTGMNADPATLDAKAVEGFAGRAEAQSIQDFLLNIIPDTVVDAFAKGNILSVVLVSILFGFALSSAGKRAEPLVAAIDGLTQVVFGIIRILMHLAPIGAFGAMAFTIGRYGLSSLGPLAKLIVTFWLTCAAFVLIVLGTIARLAGFSILRFLKYFKEEIVLVLSLSSSEPVLPMLMSKLERLGCSKGLVGLVMPTGYTFNTDGSCLYMVMAALFVAQATDTPLSLAQQLTIVAVATLTSKGASGVQGASFIALVGTMMVIPTIPVAGMALILGIDRFMSMFRAAVNVIGNGVATLVVARWERELDGDTLRRNLAAPPR